MFFNRKSYEKDVESAIMRQELLEHYSQEYARLSSEEYTKFCSTLTGTLKKGESISGDFFDQEKENNQKLLNKYLEIFDSIMEMEEDEMRRLYRSTFNRWRPEKQ